MLIGDCVIIESLPDWVYTYPKPTQEMFESCIGRMYPIVSIEEGGLYQLDVSGNLDEQYGDHMGAIFLKAEHLKRVECSE